VNPCCCTHRVEPRLSTAFESEWPRAQRADGESVALGRSHSGSASHRACSSDGVLVVDMVGARGHHARGMRADRLRPRDRRSQRRDWPGPSRTRDQCSLVLVRNRSTRHRGLTADPVGHRTRQLTVGTSKPPAGRTSPSERSATERLCCPVNRRAGRSRPPRRRRASGVGRSVAPDFVYSRESRCALFAIR
jgi:hypothetical protein